MDNTPILVHVKDADSGAPISHVDWAISVKDPEGNIIWRTTTAHSHVEIMNFNVVLPMAGESIVSLTVNSIGPKMMGMDVPPKAFTHQCFQESCWDLKQILQIILVPELMNFQ